MSADGVPRHSVEVLTFRSVKRARDIFLTPTGPAVDPHEVSFGHSDRKRCGVENQLCRAAAGKLTLPGPCFVHPPCFTVP